MAAQLSQGLVAEIAVAARDWGEVDRELTRLVLQAVGGDTAFFATDAAISPHALGVINDVGHLAREGWAEVHTGSAPLVAAGLAAGGAIVDRVLLGNRLVRIPYYDALMRPVRGHCTLMGIVTHAGRVLGKLAIGRCIGTRPFSAEQVAFVASLLPTISLAQAAHSATDSERVQRGAPRSSLVRADEAAYLKLTRREREVLDYLRLGYTNEQIGMALGTSARTVRNQLSQVYAKLSVATRAEAVAVAFSVGGARAPERA